MINIEVKKSPNENTPSLIRRFTKRVQGSSILRLVRSKRYASRLESKFKKKKNALKKMARREEVAKLKKLGKIPS